MANSVMEPSILRAQIAEHHRDGRDAIPNVVLLINPRFRCSLLPPKHGGSGDAVQIRIRSTDRVGNADQDFSTPRGEQHLLCSWNRMVIVRALWVLYQEHFGVWIFWHMNPPL